MKTILGKRFVVIGGKGGVGRTTVAAALALALARQGKRVLLAQSNAKERLSKLLGGPAVGPDVVAVRERLWAVNMNPQAALHQYGLMVLRYESVYKAVFENRMARYFLRAIPGVEEYSLLGKAWWHSTEKLEDGEPKYDTILLDGPATGHLIAMLRIPFVILDSVPEGPLTRDARAIKELLTDPACAAMVLVTLAEEMPANEVVELARATERLLHIPRAALVINQLWPERFSGESAAARVLHALEQSGGQRDGMLAPLIERAHTTRGRRQLNERYLAKLAAELPLHQARLPLLITADFGVAEVETLSRLLEEEL